MVLDVLRPIGAAYLLYLAYKIATAPVDDLQARATKPLTFTKTALFQFVNPKAWVMIVGALVTYTTTDGSFLWQVLAIALIFLVFGTPCTAAWLLMGVGLRRVISKPAQFRAFNIVMAVTLVLSLIPILFEIRDSVGLRAVIGVGEVRSGPASHRGVVTVSERSSRAASNPARHQFQVMNVCCGW